jgi:hypothetical protein
MEFVSCFEIFRLFSALITAGGWVVFLKRVVAKTEVAMKALIQQKL